MRETAWIVTAAADWLFGFPETELKETAMDNLVSIWADRDGASLDAWLHRAGVER